MLKRKQRLKAIYTYIIIASITVLFFTTPSKAVAVTAGVESKEDDMSEFNYEDFTSQGSYDHYIFQYADKQRIYDEIIIEADSFTNSEFVLGIATDYKGVEGNTVFTDEKGFVEYTFDVKEEGLYNIRIDYYPIEGKGNDIERKLVINGEVPFTNANYFTFPRIWKDRTEITQDSRGNDRRPSQVESPMWQSVYLSDYLGYETSPYLFYFKKGKNTLRLESVKEPMGIRRIVLCQYEEPLPYAEVLKYYEEKEYRKYEGEQIKIQGEDAAYKTSPMLYAINDRTSPATEPYHHYQVKLNTIGGTRWSLPGQAITWKVTVPESALYQINIKYRQNLVNGSFVTRKLMIDGKVPFLEAQNLQYYYENKWKMETIADDSGNPMLFYLEKGEHTITLEVVLGKWAEILKMANECMMQLNEAYREMLMIIGTTPDKFRDYQLDKYTPEAIEILGRQYEVLTNIIDRIVEINGQKGEKTSTLETLATQLKIMYDDPDNIPDVWTVFRDNISALGTWILTAKEQPLEIDYIILSSENDKLPSAESSFIARFFHEVKSLISSFTEDYSAVGELYKEGEGIEVWVQTGRDQASILKQMIEDDFTAKTSIPVNLKLVNGSMILPAVVTGNGPDVVLGMSIADPVNFAMRGAAASLSEFDDLDEVLTEFHPSSYVSYEYNGNLYALPETQTFLMMFVRNDILSEMGLKVPKTWDEFNIVLSELQKNHMDVGISPGFSSDVNIFLSMVYQLGGSAYYEDGIRSALDSEEAVKAFKLWTDFFTKYSITNLNNDYTNRFINRFRNGEMPIGIADYTTFNTLAVFAPELKGLWGFYPLPGFVDENGNINSSSVSSGTGTMMLSASQKKQEAWKFMKWWVSTDIQTTYGREMESLLGSAARYPTANMEAVANLSWTVSDYNSLLTQWESVVGVPQVPGGYFTSRHVSNAFWTVVSSGGDPRETLTDYVDIINKEIINKRKEFGLDY